MNGHILLITDGSPSADAAGQMATEMSLALKLPLKAVFILDEGWNNFLGDEWINTSSTRMRFFHWFEDGIHKHSQEVLAEVTEKVKEHGGRLKPK